MNTRSDISAIETAAGFDGKRIAAIIAAPDAKPGSLQALTRFFSECGITNQPGYTGNDKRHTLRLQGIASDAELMRLLKEDFPQWQQHRAGPALQLAPDLLPAPLEQPPAAKAETLSSLLKGKATGLAASAYMAGNLGLVFSALYNRKGSKPDMVKLAAPACYTLASTLLLVLNRSAPEARGTNQLWDEIAPQLLRDDFTPTRAEEAQLRRQGNALVGHAMDFMRKHPWEVNGIINMVGAGAHATSSVLRGNHTEALAALSTLTAMAVTTFVPEKGMGKLDERAFRPLHEDVTIETLELAEQKGGILRPFFDAGQKLADWIQEKPLRTASGIQLAANTGYGLAALTQRGADGSRKPDKGLMLTSGAYMAGNAFQSFASKSNGPSFDDVVSIAAESIAHQTDWQRRSPDELHTRIQRVAQGLAAQPEITHSQKLLGAGIRERLAQERPFPHSPVDGFIAIEKHALKNSPFLSPHQVQAQRETSPQIGR